MADCANPLRSWSLSEVTASMSAVSCANLRFAAASRRAAAASSMSAAAACRCNSRARRLAADDDDLCVDAMSDEELVKLATRAFAPEDDDDAVLSVDCGDEDIAAAECVCSAQSRRRTESATNR